MPVGRPCSSYDVQVSPASSGSGSTLSRTVPPLTTTADGSPFEHARPPQGLWNWIRCSQAGPSATPSKPSTNAGLPHALARTGAERTPARPPYAAARTRYVAARPSTVVAAVNITRPSASVRAVATTDHRPLAAYLEVGAPPSGARPHRRRHHGAGELGCGRGEARLGDRRQHRDVDGLGWSRADDRCGGRRGGGALDEERHEQQEESKRRA